MRAIRVFKQRVYSSILEDVKTNYDYYKIRQITQSEYKSIDTVLMNAKHHFIEKHSNIFLRKFRLIKAGDL